MCLSFLSLLPFSLLSNYERWLFVLFTARLFSPRASRSTCVSLKVVVIIVTRYQKLSKVDTVKVKGGAFIPEASNAVLHS